MRSTPFYFAAGVAAALGLWGCGGGGGSSPGSVNALANGRAALTGMASGAQPTTAASLQSALTLFQQAIKSNPNSPEARFGEAIALVGICTDQLDGNMSSGNGTGGAGSGSGGSAGTMIPAASSKAALARTRDAGGAAITLPGGAIPAHPLPARCLLRRQARRPPRWRCRRATLWA